MKRKIFPYILLLFFSFSLIFSQKVTLRYDKYYDYEALGKALNKLCTLHPDISKLEVIGKSSQGRNLYLVKIFNPKTGNEFDKTALYIEGNIHGNEIQATEVALYTIDYLLTNYKKNKEIKNLIDKYVFYILPSFNIDGRENFIHNLNTRDSSRSAMVKIDDDGDGRVDEDGYEDIDGDGEILTMIKKVKYGNYVKDKKDPRILRRVKPGEIGNYIILGPEGIDNDGDGLVNEDPIGYLDMNRNFGYNWKPSYIQMGAGKYPFCTSELKAVGDFLISHPNILVFEDLHNYGGMLLRGPDAKTSPPFPPADKKVYDFLGKEGMKIIPGYKYLVSYRDLYNVYGGSTDFACYLLGEYSFTVELYTLQRDFNGDGKVSKKERMKWNDELLMKEYFRPWKKFKHPQFGDIEIGGWVKMSTRIPPGFRLEQMCHRVFSFFMFTAKNLPDVKFDEISTKKISEDTYMVEFTLLNKGRISTLTEEAMNRKVNREDFIEINGAKLIYSGERVNRFPDFYEKIKLNGNKFKIGNMEGKEVRHFRMIVKSKNKKIKIIYSSQKGGKKVKQINLL